MVYITISKEALQNQLPVTLKVRRRIGGMHSGMPNAPARRSSIGDALPAGRMEVYFVTVWAKENPAMQDSLFLYKNLPPV